MNQSNIVQDLLAWFARNARKLPWRRTRDPYGIWISEIMLQQTQVKTVLAYWKRWMRALPNLGALARAKPERLHKLWEGLGYYTRVRNLQRAAERIRERHGGKFPQNFDDVLALPGIGPYTAGAICSIAFNQPKPILDGNVIRVLTRLYRIAGNPRERKTNSHLWRIAEELVLQAAKAGGHARAPAHATPVLRSPSSVALPVLRSCTAEGGLRRVDSTAEGGRTTQHAPRRCAQFNQSLMELGALICTPRAPRCSACPVAKHCVAYLQGRVLELPSLGRRIRSTPRRFAAFVAQKRGRFLVRQRPAGVVNAHLWEFPNVELSPEDADLKQAARRALGAQPKKLEPLGTVKHSITRYRITLEAYRIVGDHVDPIRAGNGRWLDRNRLSQLAFTSAHRQILRRLEHK
jgi:A/G-specific adenine glycosylase